MNGSDVPSLAFAESLLENSFGLILTYAAKVADLHLLAVEHHRQKPDALEAYNY